MSKRTPNMSTALTTKFVTATLLFSLLIPSTLVAQPENQPQISSTEKLCHEALIQCDSYSKDLELLLEQHARKIVQLEVDNSLLNKKIQESKDFRLWFLGGTLITGIALGLSLGLQF